jgi:hypothetical protein
MKHPILILSFLTVLITRTAKQSLTHVCMKRRLPHSSYNGYWHLLHDSWCPTPWTQPHPDLPRPSFCDLSTVQNRETRLFPSLKNWIWKSSTFPTSFHAKMAQYNIRIWKMMVPLHQS